MMERESDTYRRGLTLGLTMAEIFILILFLLLLVLLALYAFNAETEKKWKLAGENLEKIQILLTQTENERDEARSSLPKEIRRLVRVNGSLKDKLNAAKEENTIATGLLKAAEKQQAQWKGVQAVISDNQRAGESVNDTAVRLQNNQGNDNDIDDPPPAKGIDPPCWYQVTSKQGKRHEKPYFLMDIAVYDKYLEVRVLESPPGRAIDERNQSATTSYQEEYEKLPLPLLGTTKRVSLQQFATITEPIQRMGKNKQIRDYACVFYVKVWDFTPETAKTRWKKAEDAIKKSFYTLRIRKDPW